MNTTDTAPTPDYSRQQAYHARLIESGRVRMPGGFLTPEAAAALEELTRCGMSKAQAINAALIAYTRLKRKVNK